MPGACAPRSSTPPREPWCATSRMFQPACRNVPRLQRWKFGGGMILALQARLVCFALLARGCETMAIGERRRDDARRSRGKRIAGEPGRDPGPSGQASMFRAVGAGIQDHTNWGTGPSWRSAIPGRTYRRGNRAEILALQARLVCFAPLARGCKTMAIGERRRDDARRSRGERAP